MSIKYTLMAVLFSLIFAMIFPNMMFSILLDISDGYNLTTESIPNIISVTYVIVTVIIAAIVYSRTTYKDVAFVIGIFNFFLSFIINVLTQSILWL